MTGSGLRKLHAEQPARDENVGSIRRKEIAWSTVLFLRQFIGHDTKVGEVDEYQGHTEYPLKPENQKSSFFT